MLLGYGVNDHRHIIYLTPGNKIDFDTEEPASNYYAGTSGSILPDVWHFIVIADNGTSYQMFIDGEAITWSPRFSGYTPISDVQSNGHLLAGARYHEDVITPINFFEGVMDDIKIYNRALTTSEIQVLYNEGSWQ